MRFISIALAAAALALAPGIAAANSAHCPPGLAKKNPPCVPPGQAKKNHTQHPRTYHPGAHFDDDGYVRILNPQRYGLDPAGTYYHRHGDVLRIDPETRKVLNLIGAIADLMN